MSEAGTLVNKRRSGFVRTPPQLAVRIGKNILAFPQEPFNVYDPTAGEGDFFYACAHVPFARVFGSEISAERAALARQRWPHATLVTSAVEATTVTAGSMGLVLCNPPYFFQNGQRAEYRVSADAGETCMPGAVKIDIVPARSAWDGTFVNHWLKWYDHIRVWKFPDRLSEEDETTFEDYTQICVVGVRRETAHVPTAAEKKWLLGFRWKEPEKPGQSGWKGGEAPPELPTAPIADPYHVPAAQSQPTLVVRKADEATLLTALDKGGAHFAPAWQQATTWPEEGYLAPPAMPYTGEAHIAAEVMIGGLDGESVSGPGNGPDAVPHLFTAFIGKEWVSLVIDEETLDDLHQKGCIRAQLRQLQDKPILGVLNLHTGRSRYYQGEEVFQFLQPWIPTLASRVVEKRQPLYRLDPTDWEVRVLSQFGLDKRLPNATHAGLAVPQLHRVFAMCRSLDVKARTAIQGEPGTGKTRMATGTAKRQAYRWRHRTSLFLHTPQPAWVRGLRRAWLKNPLTLDMLGLEPVYGRHLKGECGGKGTIVVDATTGQIVAYREKATGRLIAPEDAGPKALPVLITTPLKVTKEYGKEILAAFPCAEVVPIESHRDIPRWLERCVTSDRPVVFGIFSHSTTRAFGREWREVVREKRRTIREPILNPPAALRDQLEPVYEEGGRKQRLVGYRFIENGKLLTKDKEISYFYCTDCGGRIDAVPGRLSQPDEKEEDKKKQGKQAGARSADDAEEEATSSDKVWPVTSRTWFTSKQRWCRCASTRRNQERRERGVAALRSPLWSDDRTKATNRKFPQASFHTWSAAVSTLEHEAEQALAHVSNRELAERVRRDDALVHRLVECVLADPWALASVVTLVERVDGQIVPFLQSVATDRSALARLILPVAQRDPAFLAPLLAGARDDELLCQRLVEAVLAAEPEEIMPLEQEPSDPILALVLEVALRVEAVAQALLQTFLPQDQLASLLVDLATRDLVSFKNLIPRVVSVEAEVLRLVGLIRDAEAELAERLVQAVRRDGSSLLLLRLVEVTRPHMDWQPLFFRSAVERVQTSLSSKQARKSGGNLGGSLAQGNRQPGRGVRLTVTEGGPLIVEEPDLAAAEGYTEVSEHGSLVAYEMGHQGRRLYPLYGRWSRRIVGYVDAGTGQLVTTQTSFSFGMPPADSFSPYEYLDAFFPGCVALAVVDESHNGRGRSTDIAHSHHCAMLAAQTRELTSGTHYGGDILGFYHYWFRFTPQFWLSRGYGWNDAEKALADYGVIQEWTKEYESDARKGSGQTDVYVSTVPAPGLSANLIPGLLEDLTYLTVLDVGAHMPPKEEIPRGIPMKDPHLEAATREADQAVSAARQAVKEIQAERTAILQTPDSRARQTCLADIDARLVEAQARLKEAQSRLVDVRLWVSRRDLAAAYTSIADNLAELASERNAAARLAQGTIPRWFAALPCESPFQLYQAKRGDWGDKEEPELVIETPVLSWDYLYPMERWFVEVARAELAEGRRVMFYFEQNAVRSMAKRLAWVLKEFNPWTLPNGVEAEERQQAIIEAVEAGHGVVIVPYRRVNEGLNLQKVIDTIVWAELAQNLFFYTQASQRAWRLGKENLVKIYIPYYIGSAAHKQVRRLGERDGAAAAFAGEPAKGGLVHHVGADQTTLARLSAQIEEGERAWWEAEAGDDSAVIEANFARRNAELAAALRQGREWFGLVDTLAERLSAILAGEQPDVWASMPPLICLPEVSLEVVIPPDVEHAPAEQQEPVETPTKPASGGLSPATVSTESGDRPEPPTVLHPAVSASSVQPPRVAILFGNEADIQRVRLPRKGRSRRTLPKLKHPVIVKDIPAVVESNTAPAPVQDDLLLLSLWDTAGMPEDPATPAGPPSRPAGSSLPAGSLWDLADAS